ncbi:UNVERIFIED_CONTAM: transglycosylase domain-containing protein, partial [Salmonella enterica subsp. enterica serovar Weltevreden]
WGEGVFGAEAAAQHYFRKSADRLAPAEAARLAVMLPAPKRFEKMPNSAYLAGRTRTILARMGSAELP